MPILNSRDLKLIIFYFYFVPLLPGVGQAQQMDSSYYSNGQLRSLGLIDLQGKQGKWVFYYPNGAKNSVENYIDDLLDGTIQNYNHIGKLISSENWRNGVPVDSAFYYYDNGRLRRKGVYKDGLYDGEWVVYFDNGKLERKGSYTSGLPEGEWLNYNLDGYLIEKGTYADGRQHGFFQFFDDKGRLIYEGHYKNGKEIGEWYFVNKHGKRKLYKVYE